MLQSVQDIQMGVRACVRMCVASLRPAEALLVYGAKGSILLHSPTQLAL